MTACKLAQAYQIGGINRRTFVYLWDKKIWERGEQVKKINDGVYVTKVGMILSGEKRLQLANLFGIQEATTPVTIEREAVAKVLRKDEGVKCFCYDDQLVIGFPTGKVWLSREAAMIVTDCEQFRVLYEWVVGS